MKIRKLKTCEHERTRILYEEVFAEDEKAFVDYYYRVCAAENEIFVWETDKDEIVSMLHLNPYRMRIGEREAIVNYIVAVATREAYRGRGLMRGLLLAALAHMDEEKQPFTFLMPAAEAIYTPYDFRFIYRQKQFALYGKGEQVSGGSAADVQAACLVKIDQERGAEIWKEELNSLEAFAQRRLKKYRTASLHTQNYFQKLIEEQACQNGEIMVQKERGEIWGYYFTAREGDALEVREAVAEEGRQEQLLDSITDLAGEGKLIKIHGVSFDMSPEASRIKSESVQQVPVIMARIVHLEAFVSCLSAKERVELNLKLEDPILKANEGNFRLVLERSGGRLIRLAEERSKKAPDSGDQSGVILDATLTVSQFVQLAFGYADPGEMQMPEHFCMAWKKVCGLGPVFLNEIV